MKRSGVTASVISRKLSPQIPSRCSSVLDRVGAQAQTSHAKRFQHQFPQRHKAARKTRTDLVSHESNLAVIKKCFAQIQPGIELRNFLCVAIEHQGVGCFSANRACANPAFSGLAPAWMI